MVTYRLAVGSNKKIYGETRGKISGAVDAHHEPRRARTMRGALGAYRKGEPPEAARTSHANVYTRKQGCGNVKWHRNEGMGRDFCFEKNAVTR